MNGTSPVSGPVMPPNEKWSTLSSHTWMLMLPVASPGAVAVTTTLCGPWCRLFCTAVKLKAAEVWPAGMVTLAGTVKSPVLLDARLTTKGTLNVPPICTVPAFCCTP